MTHTVNVIHGVSVEFGRDARWRPVKKTRERPSISGFVSREWQIMALALGHLQFATK